jgi:uncharacterized membrane protein
MRHHLRRLYGIFFVAAGINHFVNTAFYRSIMPPYLPWHGELVWLSGAAECVLGALLCIQRTSRVGGWGLVALLLAVFPANVHMALNSELYPGIPVPALWARLPLQGVLIALAIYLSSAPANAAASPALESPTRRPTG